MAVTKASEHSCANCKWKNYADKNPGKILSRLWIWHSGWCPAYKEYQKLLAKEQAASRAS